MSASRRRRIAVGVAIALGVAFALARRQRQPASAPPAEQPKPEPVSDWLAAPAPSPPAQPRPAPVTVLPPLVAARPDPAPPPPRRRIGGRSALVAGVAIVAAALLAASLALKSNSSRLDSFGATLPTTSTSTTPTTTPSTTPTTTASPGSRTGGTPLCVTSPKGWKSAWIPSPAVADPPALVLTNFRFGKSSLEWGLLDPHVRWAGGDIMVVVADWTKAASPAFRSAFLPSALRVRRADVVRYGTFPVKIGHRLIKTGGRLLEVWVEARPPRASTLTAANRVLAAVGVCAAKSS
jgi:hypothetical protein